MTCLIRIKTDPIVQILLAVWKMDVLYISYALNKTITECLENELVSIIFREITKYCSLIASWKDQFPPEMSSFPGMMLPYTFYAKEPLVILFGYQMKLI